MSQSYGTPPQAIPPTQAIPPQRPTTSQPQYQPAQPQYQPAPHQQYQPAPQQPRRRHGTEPTAVAALISGLVGLVVPLVGILAIVFGGIGRDRTRRRGTGGRGMATTGAVLGTFEVVVSALVVVGALMFWNAYGDDIEAGLAQVEDLTQSDISLSDLAGGLVSGGVSLDDLGDLAGMAGNAGELQDLGGQCQGGDAAACQDLLDQVPPDLLPSGVEEYLPAG